MEPVERQRLDVERERIRKAKEWARENEFEVLAPSAAARLFGKSAEAVHKALTNDRIRAAFDLWFTDRRTPMMSLSSAIEYWGEPEERELNAMRENGLTLDVHGIVYNVLHWRPLTTLRDPEELEETEGA